MFDWVPAFVVDFMSKKALTDATGWVKKYSEMEWAKAKREGTATSRPKVTTAQPAMLPFGKRKRVEEEERRAAELAASEERAEEERRRGSVVTIRAGWRRYVLVSVVLVLAIMNAVMFFGDDHEKNQ
jgi:hypothetical protein